MNTAAPIEKKSLRFRARSFVAFALTPEVPIADWLHRLDRWTANSPGFFEGRPVVLDLSLLEPSINDVASLVSLLSQRRIRVYAIEAPGVEDLGADLPPLLIGAKDTLVEDLQRTSQAIDTPKMGELPQPDTKIIDQPIRSGQSIFHPHGDVVVLGSVGSGSEIIAGGSIHIYGTLRGRAFAGASGCESARIFCRRNEAELLAVDGWYRTADDIEPSTRGRPIQAHLDNGVLWVTALD